MKVCYVTLDTVECDLVSFALTCHTVRGQNPQPAVTALQGGEKKNKYGSSCMPMPGWDLRILDETGKEVGMGDMQRAPADSAL